MGEDGELLIMLALNRARVASQREIAISWWGLDEVAEHWDTTYWMRARIRYRLEKAREIERQRRDGG